MTLYTQKRIRFTWMTKPKEKSTSWPIPVWFGGVATTGCGRARGISPNSKRTSSNAASTCWAELENSPSPEGPVFNFQIPLFSSSTWATIFVVFGKFAWKWKLKWRIEIDSFLELGRDRKFRKHFTVPDTFWNIPFFYFCLFSDPVRVARAISAAVCIK